MPGSTGSGGNSGGSGGNSPFRVVASTHYESGPPSSKIQLLSPDDVDVFETVKEEEWVTRKKKVVKKTKNIERRVQRQLMLEDGQVVEDSGPVVTEDATEETVTKETVADEHNVPEGQEGGAEEVPLDEGWTKVPGTLVVSEKTQKTVHSHQVAEDSEETEEVTHLGDVTNQEVDLYVAGKSDLEALTSSREGRGWEVAKPERRLVSQSARKWGSVDTHDLKETSRVQDGNVVTETERTTQHEQYENETLPDSTSSISDGSVHEKAKESHHNITHTKDEDFVEFYAVPKGGTLADGVKLGERMHVVSEDFQEDKEGDDLKNYPDYLGKTRFQKLKESLGERTDALTQKPLDYHQEEETRKSETNKWLENHFGSDSSNSKSSSIDPREGYREGDFHRAGGNVIKITMSPRPATPEDNVDSSTPLRRWDKSMAHNSPIFPKNVPPPPPLPKSTTHFASSSPQSEIQDTTLLEARAKLRSTGRILGEYDSSRDREDNLTMNYHSSGAHNDIPEKVQRRKHFSSSFTATSPVSHSGSSPPFKKYIDKDDPIYNSRFRSGTSDIAIASKAPKASTSSPREETPPPPMPSSPPPPNMGRSHSFNVSPKAWVASKFHKHSSDSFKSDLKVKDSKHAYSSEQPSHSSFSKKLMKFWPPSRETSPKSREPSPPPRVTKKYLGSKSFHFSDRGQSKVAIEAGTQTATNPVPPPRTKKKNRPKSCYFFGQDSPEESSPVVRRNITSKVQINGYAPHDYNDTNKENYYRDYTNSNRTQGFQADFKPKYLNRDNEFKKNEYNRSLSPKIEKVYKTTKTITPVITASMPYSSDTGKHVSKPRYQSAELLNSPVSSWTNTIDPRRKPKDYSQDLDMERPSTLPRKVRNEKSLLNRRTYYFGESDLSSGRKPSLKSGQGGSLVNVALSNSTNKRLSDLRDANTSLNSGYQSPLSKTKQVGRSHSFNVQPGSSTLGRYNSDRVGSDFKSLRIDTNLSSRYQSTPYLNLRSPNLIASIDRTGSIHQLDASSEVNEKPATDSTLKEKPEESDKKARFMKGLLETAPELYKFIHGNESNSEKKTSVLIPTTTTTTTEQEEVRSPTQFNHKVYTFGKEKGSLKRAMSSSSGSSSQEKPSLDYTTTSSCNRSNSANYGNSKRHSTFNLKTSGSSLLYSPSFRSRHEPEPAPWERGGVHNKRGSGELTSSLQRDGSVLVHVKDGNSR